MKISVCMATCNGEKYIRLQLESILSQLSASDEIIISDDSSKDNTISIINPSAFGPTTPWKSPCIMPLAPYPNRNPPTDSAEEPLFV